jgi:hypothetical protein
LEKSQTTREKEKKRVGQREKKKKKKKIRVGHLPTLEQNWKIILSDEV